MLHTVSRGSERAVFSHTRGAQVTLMVNSTGLVVREDNKTKKPVATYPIKKIQYQLLVRHPACLCAGPSSPRFNDTSI